MEGLDGVHFKGRARETREGEVVSWIISGLGLMVGPRSWDNDGFASAVSSRRVARPASYKIAPLEDFSTEEEDEAYPTNVNGVADDDAQEEEEDQDGECRCVCNGTVDGLTMIQCEECFVWQHSACMGIDDGNEPNSYFCELCKPEDHPYPKKPSRNATAKTSGGSTTSHKGRGSSTSQPSSRKSTSTKASKTGNANSKKRSTMNSRDAVKMPSSDDLKAANGKAGSLVAQGKEESTGRGGQVKSTGSSRPGSKEGTRSHSPSLAAEAGPSRAVAPVTRRPRSGGKRQAADQPAGLSTPVSSEEDLTAARQRRGSASSAACNKAEEEASASASRISKRKRGAVEPAPVVAVARKRKAAKHAHTVEDDDAQTDAMAVDVTASEALASSSAEVQETGPTSAASAAKDAPKAQETVDALMIPQETASDKTNSGRRSSSSGESVASESSRGPRSLKRSFPDENALSETELAKGDAGDTANDENATPTTSKAKAVTAPRAKKARKGKAKQGKAATKATSSTTSQFPPKPRVSSLHPDMTIQDMRKRVGSIADYMQRVQTNLADEASDEVPWFRLGVFPFSTLPGVLEACSPEVAEKIRRGAERAAAEKEEAAAALGVLSKSTTVACTGNDSTIGQKAISVQSGAPASLVSESISSLEKSDSADTTTDGRASPTHLPTPPLSQTSSSTSSTFSIDTTTVTNHTLPSVPVASPPVTPTTPPAITAHPNPDPPNSSGSSSGVAPSSRASHSSSCSPPNASTGTSSGGHAGSDCEGGGGGVDIEKLARSLLGGN
ncbi:hypothetical protein HDU67_001322 [Dinochytrium kinnereticum]|nr:hypothetical protein HDU67_001322 [Dinochytrium kinnereticum]